MYIHSVILILQDPYHDILSITSIYITTYFPIIIILFVYRPLASYVTSQTNPTINFSLPSSLTLHSDSLSTTANILHFYFLLGYTTENAVVLGIIRYT